MNNIDYVSLRTVQNNERNGMGLTNLPEQFYTDVFAYINILKENNEKNPSMISIRDYENTRKIVEEIIRIRLKKIVLSALQFSALPKNILSEEKELYETIKKEIIGFESRFFSEKKSTGAGQTKEKQDNIPSANIGLTNGFKKIKILKDIPQYKGSDGKIYGPYQPETSISIPVVEAEFLVSNKMAEIK